MFACSRRAALALPLLAVSSAWAAEDSDNTVVLTTKHGKVTIKLRPDWAPKHVAQIKTLVKQKFYDGLTFHRVIPGLHGPDRRPDRNRLRRLEPSRRAGRVQPDPFQARHPRHGARGGSELGQFAVLHHDRATPDSSTANIRPSARSPRAWTSSTRSRPEPRTTTAPSTNPDKIVTMRMASGAK